MKFSWSEPEPFALSTSEPTRSRSRLWVLWTTFPGSLHIGMETSIIWRQQSWRRKRSTEVGDMLVVLVSLVWGFCVSRQSQVSSGNLEEEISSGLSGPIRSIHLGESESEAAETWTGTRWVTAAPLRSPQGSDEVSSLAGNTLFGACFYF